MDSGARVEAVRRLTWIAGLILLWGVLIFAKLVVLQVVRHDEYVRLARQQQEMLVEVPAPRGSMYDRNGHPLAMSIQMDSVTVNPRRVPDLVIATEILSRILHLDQAVLYGRIKWAKENNRGFLPIKRKISPEESESLKSLHLDWIQFETESQRHYPKGSIAAHVMGSVNHEERGNAGLEQSMDEELRGHVGEERMLTDVKRRGITSHVDAMPQPGTPLTLTIDERIQFAAERELARAVEESHGSTGSVVVMNPNTGDVLAMASFPSYDPNVPPKAGDDPKSRFNEAVSVPFEPGSVFKVVTLSAALETTNLRPDTIINCGSGAITLFGRTIHEAHRGYGSIPMAMVLAKSSNIGAIQIGMRVGQENLYNYVRRFGFGQQSGIPLPAESGGMVRKLSRWGKTSLNSVSMGHEISTTTVQLARACSVIANGGLLVKPRLILRDGHTLVPVETPVRALKPETAIAMRQMMEGVVLHGTGTRARLEGYTSGGKTGSAQIFDFATKHYTHSYNASFIGFAPVTNPAIVVAVTVNHTHMFGGLAAAPVFKTVAEEALRVLDIPKDLPDMLVAEDKGKADPEDLDDVAIADLGSGEAPELEMAAQAQAPVLIVALQPDSLLIGPRVPNFQGKTMRAVVEEASAKGLPLIVDGSGIARIQQPPPGSMLHDGERIRVRFGK